MKKNIFNTYGIYYDLIYSDKNYLNEVNYIKNILRRFGIKKGDLLEFGSGTGIHGTLLSNEGFKVHGIEISKQMVAKAKKERNFVCVHGDITTKKMGRTYNAVVSLFHVISYLTTKEQLNLAFLNASDHLNEGGLFIFDFWYRPAVFYQKPSIRIKRIEDKKYKLVRIAEPTMYNKINCVEVNYSIFVEEIRTKVLNSFKETHLVRHFSLKDLDSLASTHGFERVHAEEFMTKKKLSKKTWSACVILKKRKI